MSKHDDKIRVQHMIGFAREAVGFISDKTQANLETERMLDLSLLHLITLIGEAASQIAKEFQDQHPEIAWLQIIGMRNRLVHEYDFVDYDILWQTVTGDLPPLIADLEKLLSSEPADPT